MLITEAGAGQKMDRGSKVEDKSTSGPSKEGKVKPSSESHIEMDSRLLSALLTVSSKFSHVHILHIFYGNNALQALLHGTYAYFPSDLFRELTGHFLMFQAPRQMMLLRSKHQCSSNW